MLQIVLARRDDPHQLCNAERPAKPLPLSGMQLHIADGGRKYLTAGERAAFLGTAERADCDTRTLASPSPTPAAASPRPSWSCPQFDRTPGATVRA